MTGLIFQMLGCLIVAAGIGAAVGWLWRHQSTTSHEQQMVDCETELRVKGEALDTALYELKLKSSTHAMLEAKVATLESLARSTEQDLIAKEDRISALQKELASARQRLLATESEHTASLCRLAEHDSAITAYVNEARQANAARTVAQQELLVTQKKISDLEQQLVASEKSLKELSRLRDQIASLKPYQGRVQWLEAQLSEKDAEHRVTLKRMKELLHHAESRERHTAELERRVSDLESIQAELAGQAEAMGRKEEEISRLRKRLVEVRAALRVRTDGGHVVARSDAPENQLSLQISQSKFLNSSQKDDLKKISGIGPVLERALNKMGTYSYIQIAKWTSGDIAHVAAKIGTAPDRIKREKWIAAAKKHYREKYGEKI
ncbi:hypothetical protein [Petrachloros mirabilis]